ncbi:MAG: hypothetical protein IJ480_03600 [Clostridia bacterium]|nr:hypothetical protein [Clostridia bacterium]
MMINREILRRHAVALYDFCTYPAVRYKILYRILDVPYDDPVLTALRPDFLASDIVEEMFTLQDRDGGWGPLWSKDYSVKSKIPTSMTGIDRCQYIGLALEDRDILFMAKEYLESFLLGTAREKNPYEKNERAVPWGKARICTALEGLERDNPLCDETFRQWEYIAGRAYLDGEYSYERDRAAQHDVFLTREDRLIPMQCALLLKRRERVPESLEEAMLRHIGRHAAEHGHFWDKTVEVLPESFYYKYTRRWMSTFHQVNQFRGSVMYLSGAVEWLMAQAREDGLWDWGTQVRDPWGYFGYHACGRQSVHNRVVDCSMEILGFLKIFLDHNT